MVKSTAVVLGFLFCLSTAYYLSFWSYFNIDVFQYLAIGDIIKGVAYPLRIAGLWLLGVCLFIIVFFAVAHSFDKENEVELFGKIIIVAVVLASITAGVAYVLVYRNEWQGDVATTGRVFAFVASYLAIWIYLLAYNIERTRQAEEAKKPKEDQKIERVQLVKVVGNIITILIITYLPINAIITGQIDAIEILNYKKYNYMMRRDFPKDKIHISEPYLIFLGAISEKYIFTDRAQTDRFIIDKEELPIIRIHYFDALDSASVKRQDEFVCKQLLDKD